MKKIVALALALVLALGIFAACGKTEQASYTIAVPNDTTNEARALLLLENLGLIKLKGARQKPGILLYPTCIKHIMTKVNITGHMLHRLLYRSGYLYIKLRYKALRRGPIPFSTAVTCGVFTFPNSIKRYFFHIDNLTFF